MRTKTALLTIVAAILFAAPAFTGGPGTADAATGTPTFQNFQGPSNIADLAGEPSIGYNPTTGAVMFQSYTRTIKVTFNDLVTPTTATWTNRQPPTSIFNIDPILFTDQGATPPRTYAGGLNGECSILAYSDNDGTAWTPMTNSCASPAFDHQTIGAGPWMGSGPVGVTYNRAVYYCAQLGIAQCATSSNGGLSFGAAVPVQGSCGGLHGHVKVGPNGVAYLPFSDCGGRTGLGITLNNGLTWGSRVFPWAVPNAGTPANGFDPSVGIAPNNTLYVAWQGQDNHPMVAVSSDGGLNYYNVKDLSTTLSPAIVQSTFQTAVVGDNNRAAVAFLGSTTSGNPFASSWNGVWDLYVSYTFDGGATWTTVKATTDPVQRGWICAGGTGCGAGRNLLDFMDAQLDKEGRVLVAYVDGCVGACAAPGGTSAQSTSAAPVITRQIAGRTLYAAYDGVFEGLRALPGGPYAGTLGGAVPLAGRAVGGDAPYAYAWTVETKPAGSAAGASSFSDAASATSAFTPDVMGSYTLRLAVTDGAASTTSALATVTVSPPAAPLVDPAGDATLPGTDIREASVGGETAATFDVVLKVDDLAAATPSTANANGVTLGADTSYTVGWTYAESATNAVRYQVSASRFTVTPPGQPAVTFTLNVLGSGTTNYVSDVASVAGVWDDQAGTITWTVPKAAMVVKKAPTGPGDAGVMTGGRAPVAGDTFVTFDASVNTWFYAGVGVGPSFTRWDTATGAGTHTLSA